MGEEALVESKITDAISLVQQLDLEGMPPSLALWYFYNDAAEWRLLIAGSEFDALLPKQESVAYQKLVKSMSNVPLSSLSLSDVKLIEGQSPLPLAIHRLIGTGPRGIVRAHFSDTTLNGIFIKEMVILRSV